MSNQYEVRRSSPALGRLADIVAAREGIDAQAHLIDDYAVTDYPVISGELQPIEHALESARMPQTSTDLQRTAVAGRIVSLRLHARFGFIDIADTAGDQIQVIVQRPDARLGETDTVATTNETLLRGSKQGDILVVDGQVGLSKRGEPSIVADTPIARVAPAYISPNKIGSDTTAEEHAERVKNFRVRSRMKASMRRSLEGSDYTEVTSPILNDVPSGANAEVFSTHIDALDRDVYLRISPELALKTAIVNGYADRVYEFATDFRNEGIDREHSPEFEMLEFYSAYTSAEQLRDFTAQMIGDATHASLGTTRLNLVKEDGVTAAVDLGAWSSASYRDLFVDGTGIDLDQTLQLPAAELKGVLLNYVAGTFGSERATSYSRLGAASIIDKVFKLTCRPSIQDPTFVERYPTIMVPLARPTDADPNYVDMFQGIVGSTELIKGYQELNDPVKQLENLYDQARSKAAGDTEAMTVDWEYLQTMLRGLPPTAGCGIGIDRLGAVLNGTKNIHSTMPYPFRERFMQSVVTGRITQG